MVLNSLRAQLIAWLLIPLALLVALNTWLAYNNAMATATAVYDRTLVGSARFIAENIRYEDGVFQVEIPPAALELFQSSFHDRVYYRIAATNGPLLSGYAELPPPPGPLQAEESIYFDAIFRGEPIRVVAFAQPVFAAAAKGPVLVEVAQTLESRTTLVHQIWLHTIRQQLLILALAVVFVGIGLHRGLAPLLQLRDRMHRRKPGTLEPLDTAPVPNEVAPLVHAINDYVRQLDDHMSAHSRFIANASHQLRTPLTVFNTQVNFALRSEDIASKNEALRALHKGLQQGIRVANQLLTLSTAEVGIGHPLRQSDVNLVEVVQEVLEQLATFAQAKNIDLGFESQGGPAVIRAPQSMAHELVANLVDNALRYTPAGGIVTAVVITREDAVVLRIEDNGPGIPADERERVFERFYRLQDARPDGCGLGLPIVREIATASEAHVTLADPPVGTGLVVTVTFPRRPASLSTSQPPASGKKLETDQ